MSFAAPFWLLGLVPWALLALWLLAGRREQARVPFLQLWPTQATPVRVVRARLQPPPVALVCLLLAMLLAIVGAARPVITVLPRTFHLTLIIDRHVTLTTKDQLAVAARDALYEQFGLHRVDFVLAPDGTVTETDESDWIGPAVEAKLTSFDTKPALRSAVRDTLRRSDSPVIVLSNQALGIEDERVVLVSADAPPRNVGLVRVAARARPNGQVMLTVRNQSPQSRAELMVSSEGQTQRQPIELPAVGSETNYFVDLPQMGRTISVELIAPDDIAADNRAWLVRQRGAPTIEARGALPPELLRMIETYREHRPSDNGAPRVTVAPNPIEGAGAIVASQWEAEPLATDRPLDVADHPVNANVDWTRSLGEAHASAASPGDGWRAIFSRGEVVLVAVREVPARQVWVGFASARFARESDFVIFWTNVFDWLAGGVDAAEVFVSEPVRSLGAQWRRLDDLSGSPPLPIDPPPGVWARDDGVLRAMNVSDVTLDLSPVNGNWREQLDAVSRRMEASAARPAGGVAKRGIRAGWGDLHRIAFVTAIGACVVASATWLRARARAAAAAPP